MGNQKALFDVIAEMLDVLLHPGCWLQNNPFSREWDTVLTDLMDAGVPFLPHPIITGSATNSLCKMRIGEFVVWTSNHPYASFSNNDWRPRRATVLRAGRVCNRPSARWSPKMTNENAFVSRGEA